MDYKQFRETNSVSGKDMISALRELYPKYGKATQSMVDNPEKYGVRVLPVRESSDTPKTSATEQASSRFGYDSSVSHLCSARTGMSASSAISESDL